MTKTLMLSVAIFSGTLGVGLLAAKYLLHALKSDAATPLLAGALLLLYLTTSFVSASGRRSA